MRLLQGQRIQQGRVDGAAAADRLPQRPRQIQRACRRRERAEQNEIRTRRREEGLFFAARSFAGKATSGVGVFLAGLMLTTISFPEKATPGAVDPEIIFNLGFLYGPVLMVLYFIALAFISRYDISRSGHERHLEILADRQK